MFGRNLLKSLATAAVLVLGATSAQALTCSINDVTFKLEISTKASCFAGNDSGNGGITDGNQTVFGLNGWLVGDSSDSDAAQTGSVLFDSIPTVETAGGGWSILGYNGFDPLMIVLKAGPQYAAFLITEAISGLSGTWAITEEKTTCTNATRTNPSVCTIKTTPKNLSHVSVYHQPAPVPVPVPAAGLLLLGALGGLAALRRRRKA